MVANTAESVYIRMICVLRKVIVFLVEHLCHSLQLNRKGANPSNPVVLRLETMSFHFQFIENVGIEIIGNFG